MRRLLLCCALTACGRIAFEPLGDGGGGVNGDGAPTDDSQVSELGLIAYYKLDDLPGDGVLDSTAYGHHGSCIGGCPGVGSLAKQGLSYDFNGMSNVIVVPDAATLRVSAMTVSLWINVRSLRTTGIMQKLFGTATENTWQVVLGNLGGLAACSSTQCLNASQPLTVGTWHHVAYVVTGTIQEVYLDAILTAFSPTTLAYDTGELLIGADRDNGSEYGFLDGRLDEIKIYDRALSASEIAALAGQ